MKAVKFLLPISALLFITCDKFQMPSYPICIPQFPTEGWTTNVYCHEFDPVYDYGQNSYPRIDFLNATSGYIFHFQSLYKTIDGGVTFTPVLTNLPCKPEIVDFIDELNGFCFARDLTEACALGAFYKTADGGATWEILFDSVLNQFNLVWSLDFFDAMHGIAMTGDISNNAYAIVTSDGGNTWTKTAYHNFKKYRQNIQLLDNSTAYAMGEDGEIFITNNKGYTWDSILVNGYEIDHYQFLSPDTGFAYFAYGLYKTLDGGLTWTNMTIPEDINESKDAHGDIINIMHFSDYLHGFMTGTGYYIEDTGEDEFSEVCPYTITYTTSDGGINWETNVINSFNPMVYCFSGPDNGFIWDGIQNMVTLSRY